MEPATEVTIKAAKRGFELLKGVSLDNIITIMSKLTVIAASIKTISKTIEKVKARVEGPIPEYERVMAAAITNDNIHDIPQELLDNLSALYNPRLNNPEAPLLTTSGILLYGKPGTGKTLMAHHIAKTLQADLVKVKAKGISDPRSIDKLFEQARDYADFLNTFGPSSPYPELGLLKRGKLFLYNSVIANIPLFGSPKKTCNRKRVVLFIDEVDAFSIKREAHADNRLTNALISEIGNPKNSDILIVAATNFSPDQLDDAFFRGGRFKKIKINLPNRDTITTILTSELQKISQELNKTFNFNDPACNTTTLVDKLVKNEYSGAEVKELVQNALIKYQYQLYRLSLQDMLKYLNEIADKKTTEKHAQQKNIDNNSSKNMVDMRNLPAILNSVCSSFSKRRMPYQKLNHKFQKKNNGNQNANRPI